MPKTSRRRRGDQFWRVTIAAWKESKQSVTAFCAVRGIGESTFFAKRRELTGPGQPPHAPGGLYVFRNKRGDRLKILAWQGDGYALYLRRLEKGTFAFPQADTAEVSITATELAMILGGVELGATKTRPRYEHAAAG